MKKYVEHLIAHITRRPVRPQWREGEHNTQPNQKFMEQMEKILHPDIPSSRIDESRKKVALGIGDWSIDNKGKDPLEHLEQIDIMKDFINRMIENDIKANEQRVNFFLQDLRTYYERGKDMKTHNLAELEPERFKILYTALEHLKEKGYCDKCITKHVFFAFTSKDGQSSDAMI